MLLGRFEDLQMPDAVIIDRAGYAYYFPGEPLALGKTFEFDDHRARLVGHRRGLGALRHLPGVLLPL